jgi:hypothetical protein
VHRHIKKGRCRAGDSQGLGPGGASGQQLEAAPGEEFGLLQGVGGDSFPGELPPLLLPLPPLSSIT